MASGIPREIEVSIDTKILRQMRPHRWSIKDSLQYHSLKRAIKLAKEKGYHGVGRFHLRRLVKAKLEENGYKIYFNCGYWIIHWS